MSVRARVHPVRLKISERGDLAKTRLALDLIHEQWDAGISASGSPFPPGKTKRIDLHASGRLRNSHEVFTTRIQWSTPYVEVLRERYNPFGIAPKNLPELERRVQPIVDREVYAEESGR